MRTVIEVEIENIQVDQYYYSFEYNIKVNGVLKYSGEYQNDHGWADDIDGWVTVLEEGEAVKLALEEEL